MDDVEDKSAVRDRLAKIAKSVGHPLELAAVDGDGEITLAEVAKLHVEEQGTSFPVPEELRNDGEPSTTSRGVANEDSISKLGGVGVDDPGLDNIVHPEPVQREGNVVVAEDMALQGVLADDEEEVVVPPSVEGGRNVEEDRDEGPEVLDSNGATARAWRLINEAASWRRIASGLVGTGEALDGEVGDDVVVDFPSVIVQRSGGVAGLGGTARASRMRRPSHRAPWRLHPPHVQPHGRAQGRDHGSGGGQPFPVRHALPRQRWLGQQRVCQRGLSPRSRRDRRRMFTSHERRVRCSSRESRAGGRAK